jgi:hypothetical protein
MSDLEADTNYGVLDAVSGYTALFLSPTIESERIREVSKRITRTFTTTPPTAAQIMDGIYVIQPIRHQFNSPIYQFQTGPVICDAVDIIYSTGSSNPIWTAFSMNYSSSASIPSYTEYIAARTASLSSGTLQTIYNESKKLAHSLYMLTAVAIPIL